MAGRHPPAVCTASDLPGRQGHDRGHRRLSRPVPARRHARCLHRGRQERRALAAAARGRALFDPARLVASGGSAGAHLAACTALVPGFDAPGDNRSISTRPEALLLYNPVLEVLPRHVPYMVPTTEMGEQISPLRYVNEHTPPTLLLYGTEDELANRRRGT